MNDSSDQRLRMVQIGVGAWGRDWARLVAPTVAEVEIVGFVDSDPRALALLRDQLPVSPQQCFNSLDDALDTLNVDAALITATLDGHAPLTRSALEAGLHVLVEKPFTDNLAAAQELVDLALTRGLTLMVSQNYRFFPAVRTVAKMMREAELGELYEISIDFRHNDPAPPNPPRRHHRDSQPLLVDMSVHHFDLMRLILGDEPVSIACDAQNPPWSGFLGPPVASCSLRFGSGVVVSYRGSWISAGPDTAWAGEWRMEFAGGQLFFTSRGEDNVLMDRVVVRSRRGRARNVPLPAMSRIDRAGALTEFAHALREGRAPETSGLDNLGTIAMVVAAVASADLQQPVQVTQARSTFAN